MTNAKAPFWSVQDEAEYIRQEQQRIAKMREAAYSAGFDDGAAWGISRGLREMARLFETTSDLWNSFPPELVKEFSVYMTKTAPEVERIIAAGMKEFRAKDMMPK